MRALLHISLFSVASLILLGEAHAGTRPLTGDWDGDGDTDIAIWNDVQRRALFDATHDGIIDGVSPALGLPGDRPFVGDWDGDGVETLALYRPSTGRAYFYADNHASAWPTVSVVLGTTEDIPISGDWDGDADGVDGFALYRPSTRELRFFQSTTATAPFVTCDAGNFNDQPISGDWNGDGIDGVALYRPAVGAPSDRTVWFAESACGPFLSSLPSIGNPGDIPVTGRWSGASPSSIGLFRPSTNQYWLFPTSSPTPNAMIPWSDALVAYDEPDGRQVFYTGGAPHTNAQGQMRATFDAAESFFPRGIYGVSDNVFGTLAAAGFNAAMLWSPLYEPSDALSAAAPHGVQLVIQSFSQPGGRPLVGRFASTGELRFGVVDGRDAWIDAGGADSAETYIQDGDPGDQIFVGDWNGDGLDTIGMFRGSDGKVFHSDVLPPGPLYPPESDCGECGALCPPESACGKCDAQDSSCPPRPDCVQYGAPGDIPIAGNWDGIGADGYVLYRPSTRELRFFQSIGSKCAFATCDQGNWNDLPVAGDFNGDGRDDLGLYRPSDRDMWLWLSSAGVPPEVTLCGQPNGYVPSFGNPGDLPIVGDWNGDGIDGVGVFRRSVHGESQRFWLLEGSTWIASVELGNPLLKRYDSEPGLLGWYVRDEPTGCPQSLPSKTEWLAKFNNDELLFDAYMPIASRPLFNTLTELLGCNQAVWSKYAALGDIACADYYPFRHDLTVTSLETIAQTVTELRISSGQQKPVWFVTQAFAEYEKWVFPSPPQYQAMVFAALVHGATGIFTFGWDGLVLRSVNNIGLHPNPIANDLGLPAGFLHTTEADRTQSSDLWSAIDAQQGGLNARLADLTPALLSPTSLSNYSITVLHTTSVASPIRALLKDGPAGRVLLAVNLTNQSVDALIQFDTPIFGATAAFENRSVDAPIGGIRDTFEPFGVHVYRWPY